MVSLNGRKSRLETVKERMCNLKRRSIEAIQTETQRYKKVNKGGKKHPRTVK